MNYDVDVLRLPQKLTDDYPKKEYGEWSKLIQTSLPISRYILDGPNNYLSIWKCPKCGTLHVFVGDNINLEKVYVPIEECTVDSDIKNTYLVFDSNSYERIAEAGINGSQYDDNLHVYLQIHEKTARITKDISGNKVIQNYILK